MPSVEQCDSTQSMAALPSTMEIFDKFKPQENGNENGKESDSEESFHLQLDDDDTENHSNSSSGKNSACNLHDETEDDILNKFDTSFKSENSDIDIKQDDGLLNDVYSRINGEPSIKCDSDLKDNNTDLTTEININNETEESNSKVLVTIKQSDDEEKYEEPWGEGEFTSLYELEEVNESTKRMHSTKKLTETIENNKKAEEILVESNLALQQKHASTDHVTTESSKIMKTEDISKENLDAVASKETYLNNEINNVQEESTVKVKADIILENDVEMPMEFCEIAANTEAPTESENMLFEDSIAQNDTDNMDTETCEMEGQIGSKQPMEELMDVNEPMAEIEEMKDFKEEPTAVPLEGQTDLNDPLTKKSEFRDPAEEVADMQLVEGETDSIELLEEETEPKESDEGITDIQVLEGQTNLNDLLPDEEPFTESNEGISDIQLLEGQTDSNDSLPKEAELKESDEGVADVQNFLEDQISPENPNEEIDSHPDAETVEREGCNKLPINQNPLENPPDSELHFGDQILEAENQKPVEEFAEVSNIVLGNNADVDCQKDVQINLENENTAPLFVESINKEVPIQKEDHDISSSVLESGENQEIQRLDNQEMNITETADVDLLLDSDKLTDVSEIDSNLKLVDDVKNEKHIIDADEKMNQILESVEDLNKIDYLKSHKTNNASNLTESKDDSSKNLTNIVKPQKSINLIEDKTIYQSVKAVESKVFADNSDDANANKDPSETSVIKGDLKTLKENEQNIITSDLNKEESHVKTQITGAMVENENSCDNDESDLFEISIIRDADEDDACAMAIAIEDQDAQDEAQSNEKSDDETAGQIDEDQVIEEDDIDDDHDVTEPLVFEEEDTNMEIDQNNEEPLNNEQFIDSESHDDTHSKDKENAEEIPDATGSDDFFNKKTSEESAKNNVILGKETCLENAVEKVMEDKGDQDQLIMDTDDPQLKEIACQQDESINIEEESNDSTTLKNKTDSLAKAKEVKKSLTNEDNETVKLVKADVRTVENRRSSTKRTLSDESSIEDELSAQKKRKISESTSEDTTVKVTSEKVKTLTAFAKYMQCKKFASKLSRSDLEQFCIQKICETFIAKSEEGEFHHTIRKQEKLIDGLRKDLQQLSKQCKDLEIVNKKLMNELRSQNNNKKPLVPLKITRSVGLQVRLSAANDSNITVTPRKRPAVYTPPVAISPQKQPPQKQSSQRQPPVNNIRPKLPSNPTSPIVKQANPAPSPQKSPLVTASPTVQTNTILNNTLLSQALQNSTVVTNRRASPVVAKRTTAPARQNNNVVAPAAEIPKPSNPGVIDLTDEDDKRPATVSAGQIRILNKGPNGANVGKTITLNKVLNKQNIAGVANQNKAVSPNKPVNKGSPAGTATRVNLQPGVRLTPGSVINTSTAGGSPQMVYVLPTIGNSKGGQQIAFVNLPTTLNGNAMMSKPITLKTTGSVRKHPAPLPAPPRLPPDPLLKSVPPKPHLTIKKIDTGIILQWKMPYNLDLYEGIASYQLYAYQETNAPPNTDMWRKVGDVKALALPMACTLTQFADKNKYYFAVRSVDVHKRIGAFSDPEEISL